MFRRLDQVRHPLYVVSALFNPVRYRSRWKLFDDFVTHMGQSGADVRLYTAEVAFGDREFAVPERENHFRWRTSSELWLKEAILNLLVQRLPADWKYLAWIDADITFLRGDWANETLHQLQHYALLQPWTRALDLDPNNDVIRNFRSYLWCYRNQARAPKLSRDPAQYYYAGSDRTPSQTVFWHPGYAWACRREIFEACGGLLDKMILGSADRLMADAAISRLKPLPSFIHGQDRAELMRWQSRLQEVLRGNVGYVEGTISHAWHGSKADRKYRERWQILSQHRYESCTDLVKDSQGLWRLRGNKPGLRDDLQVYFRQRNEDAI